MANKITSCIPNLLTICNLLSGCIAIYMSFHHTEVFASITGLEWAWIWIGAAAIFDFCDGASARYLHAYSELGGDLDSLSDLVSFGVAPAMMMLNLTLPMSQMGWLCFAALIIPACGAYRLAKFNCDTTQTTSFRGLPIPANAIFWIGMCGWIQKFAFPGAIPMAMLYILLGWLMVSNVRMFSLKFKNFNWRENFRRYVMLGATVLFVLSMGISGFVWAIALYILISVMGRKEAA